MLVSVLPIEEPTEQEAALITLLRLFEPEFTKRNGDTSGLVSNAEYGISCQWKALENSFEIALSSSDKLTQLHISIPRGRLNANRLGLFGRAPNGDFVLCRQRIPNAERARLNFALRFMATDDGPDLDQFISGPRNKPPISPARVYFVITQLDGQALTRIRSLLDAIAGNPEDDQRPGPSLTETRSLVGSALIFERGAIYNRRVDIHRPFGGQQQGGIATPANAPFVFLFTGELGDKYGYSDGLREDGRFEYTGEGQLGDMSFVRGNKAIRDHLADGKDLLLFEALKKRGSYRFLGLHLLDEWKLKELPDKSGVARKALIFRLVPTENFDVEDKRALETNTTKSLEDLREAAYAAAQMEARSQGTSTRTIYERSHDVRDYVLARAAGRCELCSAPAPFLRRDGTPYLEPHHTRRVSDGGPDHPKWVGGICPTCHRNIHHGQDGKQLDLCLQEKLRILEEQLAHLR